VRTPIEDAIALEAIRLIGRSLFAAYRDGADATVRFEMACASLMARLTMNIADCTVDHSLAQATGGVYHVAHGLIVGLVLVETLERERRDVPRQLDERVADALGVPDDGSRDGSRGVRGVGALLADLEFPVLRSLGVEEAQLNTLTELALDDFFHTQSPAPWARAEARASFGAALAQDERVGLVTSQATGEPGPGTT